MSAPISRAIECSTAFSQFSTAFSQDCKGYPSAGCCTTLRLQCKAETAQNPPLRHGLRRTLPCDTVCAEPSLATRFAQNPPLRHGLRRILPCADEACEALHHLPSAPRTIAGRLRKFPRATVEMRPVGRRRPTNITHHIL